MRMLKNNWNGKGTTITRNYLFDRGAFYELVKFLVKSKKKTEREGAPYF